MLTALTQSSAAGFGALFFLLIAAGIAVQIGHALGRVLVASFTNGTAGAAKLVGSYIRPAPVKRGFWDGTTVCDPDVPEPKRAVKGGKPKPKRRRR